MDYRETMDYLQGLQKFGMRLGLHRIRELVHRAGDPHSSLPCIHIGGTNGKGSAAAMLLSILKESGYRIGVYISPALHHFGERITVDGAPISEQDLASVVTELHPHAAAIGQDGDHPTEFELVTAAALVYFKRQKVDMMILEVGLGGRLDSTNIVENPLVSVITNVGFDHMQVLGNTLAEIAFEKAGIIKEGRPLVTGAVLPEVLEVIRNVAHKKSAPAYILGEDMTVERIGTDWSKQQIHASTMDSCYECLDIGLLGEHQAYNATLVLGVVDLLRRQSIFVSEEAVRKGLGTVRWPARFEVVHQRPVVIVDGAHNPDGIKAFGKTVDELAKERKRIMVVGILKDKDWQSMVQEAVAIGRTVIAVTPDSPRALCADELGKYAQALTSSVTVCPSVAVGIRHALDESDADDVVCVCGSLVTAAEARSCFME